MRVGLGLLLLWHVTSAAEGVHVRLEQQAPAPVLSFGLPLPRGIRDEKQLLFSVKGKPVQAALKVLLRTHDREGNPDGVHAVLVQLPKTLGANVELDVAWRGGHGSAIAKIPYREVSFERPVTTELARYELVNGKPEARDVEKKILFVGREPKTLALFPSGYLASTGILGPQNPPGQPEFLEKAFLDGLDAAFYQQPYPLAKAGFVDPLQHYDVWLYDRCATALLGYLHGNDVRSLRVAHRFCSFYETQIDAQGRFKLKLNDTKYSHNRGLYAYYALTGDEAALAAGGATAEMMLDEPYLVRPYREGKLRGKDKLFTERGLAVALENLIYGHQLTDDKRYLEAFRQLLATAYRHITSDHLEAITGWPLAPQNCLVHTMEQHEGEGGDKPFCSPWMSALLIDPLWQYLSESDDRRVDEIFIRLSRWLREVGTTCHPALVPIYGGGRTPDGKLERVARDNDSDHCPDVSAITAAAIASLLKHPELDGGKELLATRMLHTELLACARAALDDKRRPERDPQKWKSGAPDQIGQPPFSGALDRQFSWWFNTSLEQLALGIAPAEGPKRCP
jgi:hypothetical protein